MRKTILLGAMLILLQLPLLAYVLLRNAHGAAGKETERRASQSQPMAASM